ncbi:MAG: hypothetical protein ACI3X6_04275, partial [Alloprevotella sp.]
MMLRKLLWTLALCCLPWTARGQASSTFDYRYWFDNDDANVRAATASGERWHIDADLSGLDNTLHQFYFQVKDTAGVWSSPVMRLFLKYAPVGLSNNTYYWFNTNSTARTPLPAAQGKMQIDVSQLIDGVHDISIQNFADVSSPSNGYTARFLKQPVMDQLEVVYWLDNQQNTLRGGKFENGIMMLDVKDFDDGFHVLYLQATGKGGQSVPVSRMFIKVPQTDGIEYMTCLCTVDGQQYKQERVPSSGGIVNWDLDVSGLQPGVHRLQVQAITPSGAASNVYDGMFFRACRPSELAAMKCLYNIDGSAYKTAIGSYNDGLYHFDLDVAALTDGLHRLNYMMVGEDGTGTQAKSTFFVKIPVGGYGITSYKYWLNSNQEEATEVKLDNRAAVLSIVDLLPMPTAPIRSECFQFEVDKNGVPYVYAKNDLHFEFADASDRVVDAHKQFVDYNVSQEVTDITPLLPTQTFARPDENTIKWFSFEAFKGDTIAFRSSQATSLQVFSPTGQEIYVASGDKSVKYGGCHTWEDGTYYLAVHDVTGSQANIKLDFMHCERYAIVSQDVYKVGNGGYSTVTFQGNGFQELVSVELDDNAGHVIPGEIQSKESKIQTVIRFDFANSPTGIYKATFRFEDGVRTVNNCLTVETAKAITINEQVKYAVQYLKSRTNDYIINLTNEGNSTAYDVPIVIGVFTPQMEDLNKVKIDGCDLYKQRKNNMPELFTPDFETDIKSRLFSEGVKSLFLKVDSVDYVEGHPAMHRATLTVNLRPSTTETLKVSINAKSTAYVYVWYPYQWGSQSSEAPQNINLTKTVVDDARCGFATRKQQMCEENEMLIAYGQEPIYDVKDCPPKAPNRICPPPPGGGSTPVSSLDPNDIYGYTSASGSRFMSDSIQNVSYRIEFENDTTFATASAHMVEVKDTLDTRYFDLASYAPTG